MYWQRWHEINGRLKLSPHAHTPSHTESALNGTIAIDHTFSVAVEGRLKTRPRGMRQYIIRAILFAPIPCTLHFRKY